MSFVLGCPITPPNFGNGFAARRVRPVEHIMNDVARRAARRYRARAERCYGLARECPDFLGIEIMTSLGNGLLEKARRLERRTDTGSADNLQSVEAA